MRFRDDTRGLSVGLLEFFAIIIGCALLFIMMNAAWEAIEVTVSSMTVQQSASDQVDRMDQIWGLILFFVMFIAGLYIVSRSVFESRVG